MTSFSIAGEYITDLARKFLQEGKWKKSLNILSTLDGLPMEDQISIIKGDKYLSGINTVELLDDDRQETKEYKQWLEQKQNRLFTFDDNCYEPYAVIESWCATDLNNRNKSYSATSYKFFNEFEAHSNSVKKGEHFHARSLHYADDPHNDLALTIGEQALSHPELKQYFNKVVLFRKINDDIPFFLEKNISKDPLQSLIHHRRIEQRGADISYNDEEHVFNYHSDCQQNNELEDNDDISEQQELEKIEDYRRAIIDYANNDKEYGWKTLVDEDGNTMRVPTRAFLHHALRIALYCEDDLDFKQKVKAQLPPYTAISPMGLKMKVDDPFHTDSWLGAGLDLEKAYDRDTWQYQLFLHSAGDYQKDFFGYDFHLLTKAGKSDFEGIICNPFNYQEVDKGKRVLVLPHLGVEFEQIALQCDAIIAEQGGPLAHLVTVTKEIKSSIPIIRVDNACVKFPISTGIKVDLVEGKIQNLENIAKKKLKR